MKWFILNLILSKRDKFLLKAIITNKLTRGNEGMFSYRMEENIANKGVKYHKHTTITNEYMITLVELGKLEKALKC